MEQKASYAKSEQATEPQTQTYTVTIGGYFHSEFHAIPLHGYGDFVYSKLPRLFQDTYTYSCLPSHKSVACSFASVCCLTCERAGVTEVGNQKKVDSYVARQEQDHTHTEVRRHGNGPIPIHTHDPNTAVKVKKRQSREAKTDF